MSVRRKIRTPPSIKESRYTLECCFVIVRFCFICYYKILRVSFLREREFPYFFISFNKGFISRIMFLCLFFHYAIRSHSESSVMSIISYVSSKALKAVRISKIVKRADDKVEFDDVVK